MDEPLIDLEACLAPLPGDDPAGEMEVLYLVRDDLDKCRIAVDPSQYAEDDPTRPTEAVPPDWRKIIALGTETLSTKCKHLEIAARVVEALTQLHGFPGLEAGLTLLRRMVEECWDRLHPVIEDGDIEVRSGPFELLGTNNAGFNFPNTVRNVIHVSGKAGSFSWTGRQTLSGGQDAFDAAIAATSIEKCQANKESLKTSQTELASLNKALVDRMQKLAPSFNGLATAVGDCSRLAEMVAKQKGPGAGETEKTGPGPNDDDGEKPDGPVTRGGSDRNAVADRAVATRADLYRELERTAELLEKLEPRSPVPYLVRRAVALGNLSFPELFRALVQDPLTLAAITREFGLPSGGE